MFALTRTGKWSDGYCGFDFPFGAGGSKSKFVSLSVMTAYERISTFFDERMKSIRVPRGMPLNAWNVPSVPYGFVFDASLES